MTVRAEALRGGSLSGHMKAAALIVLLVAVTVLALTVVMLKGTSGTTQAREIELSAESGRFNGTNPTLELKAGERVALTVVNREATVSHDFVATGLKARTGYLQPGESETVVFNPTTPGVFTYHCSLHPGLMDGQVIVKP